MRVHAPQVDLGTGKRAPLVGAFFSAVTPTRNRPRSAERGLLLLPFLTEGLSINQNRDPSMLFHPREHRAAAAAVCVCSPPRRTYPSGRGVARRCRSYAMGTASRRAAESVGPGSPPELDQLLCRISKLDVGNFSPSITFHQESASRHGLLAYAYNFWYGPLTSTCLHCRNE